MIPGDRFAMISGAGHISNMEEPEASSRVLREFFASP